MFHRHFALAPALALIAAGFVVGSGCSDSGQGAGAGPTPDATVADTSPPDAAGTPDAEPDLEAPELPDAVATPDAASSTLSLRRVTPDRGFASGGDPVEISGTGFHDGVRVFFGESLAPEASVLSPERIVARTPPRVPGLTDVRVVSPDGVSQALLESAFLFFNPVEVLTIEPPTGPVAGGEPVTIRGTGFSPGSNVLIGGRSAISVEVLDDATIVALTPDAPGPATVDVHVSNDLGVGTLPKGYTYFEAPRVRSVAPSVGPLGGGTLIDIRGQGFVEPLVVTVDGKALLQVERLGAERVVGVTPPGSAPGPVDVVVATAFGASAGVNAFTYLGSPDPGDTLDILAVTPPSGPAGGGNIVTIVAKGLTTAADTSVRFGSQAAVVKGVDALGHVVLVEAPVGAIGAVALQVENSNGVDTASYVYDSFVAVYEVLPNFGPIAGGTRVTVTGVGFSADAAVRIGALPATDVVVLSPEALEATTPAGSPGLANVTVSQGGLSDTLVGGFAYQAAINLWVVTPDQGSRAGGTFITLTGAGFPADSDVLVGGTKATHVTVVSPTRITARTPPGAIGTVDVTVTSKAKGAAVLTAAYTYFDPESTFGGTWGQGVDGAVNVTVLSTGDGQPIPDAFVILSTDPKTPYQGLTNSQGQVTFSGPDLSGEQMVSASKAGFSSSSVIEYDAANVTIYLNPIVPPSPGPPPSGVAPLFRGQVVNATKYVPVPLGNCSSKPNAPGTLCDVCATSADCLGLTCSDLPNQGKRCTSHCSVNDDCAAGFICMPLNGQSVHQCVPSAGRVTAFCDFTRGSIFAPDYIPSPGIEVAPDRSFELALPVGEVAVFCWGGIQNDELGEFTPHVLGLYRHIFAMPGEIYTENVVMNHPLNGELKIRLDDPPSGFNGPDINGMFVYLDLGSDGVLEFFDPVLDFSDELTKTHVPKSLSGDLYDASYTLMAGAFSLTADNQPYSLTLHSGIREISDDRFYEREGEDFVAKSTGITKNINGMAAAGADRFYGVGTDGLVVRNIGSAWAVQSAGTKEHLYAVDALPSGSALAVGDSGTVVGFDGLVWTAQPSLGFEDLRGVWMASETEAFAVGYYAVYHRTGSTWSQMFGNTTKNLRGVFGFAPDDVWAVGTLGQVIHYDGTVWKTIPSGTTRNLRAVWGSAPNDVTIVGEGGTILRWDGATLAPVLPELTTRTLEAVTGFGSDDITAVGERGTILHFDGATWTDRSLDDVSSTLLAIAGAGGRLITTGTHELLLGPMLEVPENISPADGGTMDDAYEISWTVKSGVEPHFNYVSVAVPGPAGPVTEWDLVANWDVTDVLLPDFPNIEGTPGIAPGPKQLFLVRVYKEGFDIDNYSLQDLSTGRWRSWALDTVEFTKL